MKRPFAMSRTIQSILVTVLFAGGGAAVWAGENAKPTMSQLLNIRWPVSVSLSPDGTMFFVFNPDGIYQLYKVPVGKTQEDAVKLTSFADGIGGYVLSDDGKQLIITASAGGSEQSDIHLMDADTGVMKTLYADPDVVYGAPIWRRDSKAFAFQANDTSPSDFHIYVHDLTTGQRSKVLDTPGYQGPVEFNRDGTRLVVSKYNSATFTQLFEIDLTTNQKREITPAGEQWSFDAVGYTATDRAFLVSSNYHGDFKRLFLIDLRTNELRPIAEELAAHEVDWATMNEDKSVVAVGVNERGYRTLHLRRASDFASLATPPMGQGLVGGVSFRDRYMLYALNSGNTPGITYRWDLNAPDRLPVPVTTADTQGLDVSTFCLPQLTSYPSFDGTKIPAFLYLPKSYEPGQKIPFLVYYHGGPEGQFRPRFSRGVQYFVSRGFGVIAPNIRGSSGYGKAWLEADNYRNRSVSVRDGIYAAKYVIDQGYARKGHIGAWGGSYGGFMVMAVLTEAPDLFAAGCNVVGIVNFKTFLENTKAYRRALREVEYGPLSDPEFLASVSPIHKVDKIEAALMLAHGLNDPRVPIGEAMQVAVALKKRGKTVTELYFPDEGHGFAKTENRLLYYQELARFFEKHLKP